MSFHQFKKITYFTCLFFLIVACDADKKWSGQGPIKTVPTDDRPIQFQHKSTFDLGAGVFVSNDFDGGRLNGIIRSNDTLLTGLITAENTPINPSPWYAFKIWADQPQEIYLRLTYPPEAFHRYYPRISNDGSYWEGIDSASYQAPIDPTGSSNRAKEAILRLSLGTDTLWVAAQELIRSRHVHTWMQKLVHLTFVDSVYVGKSHEGRTIAGLKIGEGQSSKMVMVMALQHPPEIPAYLAMQSFVEKICEENETAKNFREQYTTYVVPVVNPDGVDLGHWRHNSRGIDINRDWKNFNQPEPRAIKNFMENQVAETGGKFYFGIDFHSTWEDIYYTINPELSGNMPGLVPRIIQATDKAMPSYEPNVRPSPGMEAGVTSSSYFFFEHGAEALTYEVGDNTPRDFIRTKAEVTAAKMMELMIRD